jgi:hypothetical protein
VAFVAALHGDPAAYVERVNCNKNLEHLTVNAAAGDDTVTLDDNWAATTLNGGDGKDTFQIGQIFKSERDAAAGIAPSDLFATLLTTRGYISNGISYDTTINGDADNESFTVFHNAATLQLNGGAGDDLFTIRAFALEGSRTTNVCGQGGNDFVQYVINAPVNVDGGIGDNTLRIIGTEFSDQFVITNVSVYGAGISLASYINIATLQIDAAEGNDTFYVLNTSAGVRKELYGGLGSDRFIIAGDVPDLMSGATIIYAAAAGSHKTDGIAGDLIIDGGPLVGSAGGLGTVVMLPGETNVLPPSGPVLSYTGAGLAGTTDTMVVPTASLDAVRIALSLANLTDLVGQTVEISAGPGVGRFWLITGLVDNGDSSATLQLKNPGQPAAEWGLPDATSLFAITHLSSNFFVTESEQVDFATVYNDASTTDDTGTRTTTQITGLNMGAPGVVYGNLEGLDIFLGSGGDTFNVNSTMKRNDGFQVVTMLSNGAGDDDVTVTLSADTDGMFSVNGEAGNDTIGGSGSTLPLVIFGGPGDDTLTGGTGNDIIFGDDTIIGNDANIATPFTTTLPVAQTNFAATAVGFFNLLSDMQYLTVDFGFVVQQAHLQVLNSLANDAVAKNPAKTLPKASSLQDPGRHVLPLTAYVSVVVRNLGNLWLPLGEQVNISFVARDMTDTAKPDIVLATLNKQSVSSMLASGSATFSAYVNRPAGLPADTYQVEAIITPVTAMTELRPDNNTAITNALGNVLTIAVR